MNWSAVMKSVIDDPLNCSQFTGRTSGNPMNAVPPDSRLSLIER